MDDPVVIAEYSPSWAAEYSAERARIIDAIGDAAGAGTIEVEHVGSTAVPGLAAKPVIDVMIGLRTLDDAAACIPALERLGYEYVAELERLIPERRYLRRRTNGIRSHQIHMVETTSPFWKRHLLFRDYLREHPDVALEYERVKRALAAAHSHDRVAYTDAKTGFIEQIEALAAQATRP